MGQFLNRPKYYEDESDVGYMMRLVKINYCAMNYLDLLYPRVGKKYNNEGETLKKYIDKITCLSGEIPEKNNILYYCSIDRITLPKLRHRYTTRYCPLCISQQVYHRTNWSLSHYTYCIFHKVYLIEECPNCSKLTIINDIVSGTCNRCHFELKNNTVENIEENSDFLGGIFKLTDSPYLTVKHIWELQSLNYNLIRRSGILSLTSIERKRLVNGYFYNVKILHHFMNLSFRQLQETKNSDPLNQPGLRKKK
jgi:hypothetical protein